MHAPWIVVVFGLVVLIFAVGSSVRAAWKHRDRPIQRAIDEALGEIAQRFGFRQQGLGEVAAEDGWDMLGRAIGRHRGYNVQVVMLARPLAFATQAEDRYDALTLVEVVGASALPDNLDDLPERHRSSIAEVRAGVARATFAGAGITLVIKGERGCPEIDATRIAACVDRASSLLKDLGVAPHTDPPTPAAFVPVPRVPPRG